MNTNGNKPRNPSPEELSDLNDRIARFGAILVAIAVVLFVLALPTLIGCFLVVGGIALLIPVVLVAIAWGILKACV